MPVFFTKTFVHAGQQLVVQRRLIPVLCHCNSPHCQALKLVNGLTMTTIISAGEIELMLPLVAAENTPAAAQQLVDLFGQPDAEEAMELLQASFYQVENSEESEVRLEALRNAILSRIPAES